MRTCSSNTCRGINQGSTVRIQALNPHHFPPPLIIFTLSVFRRQAAILTSKVEGEKKAVSSNAAQDSHCKAARPFSVSSADANFHSLRLPCFSHLLHHRYPCLAFISVMSLSVQPSIKPDARYFLTPFALQVHASHPPHATSALTTIADFTSHLPPGPFPELQSPTARSSSPFCYRGQQHQTHLRHLPALPAAGFRM